MDNIILIGPPGVGKTTVANLLSSRLLFSYIDIDSLIYSVTGCSIDTLFKYYGEPLFRQYEYLVIRNFLFDCEEYVCSVGAGAVRMGFNLLSYTCSIIVYLTADIEVLMYRLLGSQQERPLLCGDSLLSSLKALCNQRQQLYEHLADITINTSKLTADEVVEYLMCDCL